MKWFAAFLVCISIHAGPAVARTDAGAVYRVMENTVTKFVRPGYHAFGVEVEVMAKKVASLCRSPKSDNLELARAGFSNLVEKWASIEIIRFGPIADDNRFERVLFYPDRKSTGLKQVQRILAKEDETAIEPSRLARKSVAVQGLGALEFLLFGRGAESLASGSTFRCNYATAIIGNLKAISDEVIDGWAEDSVATRTLTRPGESNSVLRTPAEAVNQLLGTLVHGLETIKDIRIGAFLKEEAKKDRPRVAIFRRSNNTMRVIAANIRSVNDLVRISASGQLLSDDDHSIISNIAFELRQAEAMSRTFTVPVSDLLKLPDQRGKLEYVGASLGFAIKTLDVDFAAAAGLSSGFSFSDGD